MIAGQRLQGHGRTQPGSATATTLDAVSAGDRHAGGGAIKICKLCKCLRINTTQGLDIALV